MTPKIALLVASSDTDNALRAWALARGFDLTRTHGGREITPDQFDFHVTLLATKNAIRAPETDHLVDALQIEATGFDVLGKADDVPVLRVKASAALKMAREFFVEMYGAEPTFEDFKPHVSLSYKWDGAPALEDLELPTIPLLFDRLIVKAFDLGHKALLISERTHAFPGAHMVYR